MQWAAPLCGRALVELGEVKRGLRVLEEGLAAHTITRSALLRPYYFVLLAGALLRVKEYDRAQRALDDARAVAASTSQHAYASELHRLQAELLTLTGNRDGAERSYRDALTTATNQGALWLELRAARAFANFLAAAGARRRGAIRPAADARAHHRRAGDARLRLRRRSSSYTRVAVRGKLDLPARLRSIDMSTTIGKGVNITGSLTADEPVSIVGTLNGEVLVANHSVTVETGGHVEGAVTARVITVQGGSAGRLIARDVVRVLVGAIVKADVTSPKLALEDGALFNGRVDGGARAEAATRVAAYRQTNGNDTVRPYDLMTSARQRPWHAVLGQRERRSSRRARRHLERQARRPT